MNGTKVTVTVLDNAQTIVGELIGVETKVNNETRNREKIYKIQLSEEVNSWAKTELKLDFGDSNIINTNVISYDQETWIINSNIYG